MFRPTELRVEREAMVEQKEQQQMRAGHVERSPGERSQRNQRESRKQYMPEAKPRDRTKDRPTNERTKQPAPPPQP